MKRSHQQKLISILFLLPALTFLTIFILVPLVQNFYNSFFEYSVFSPEKIYVGTKNLRRLFSDNTLKIGLINNVKYAIISVICQVGFGLVIAAILEEKVFHKIAPFFRVVYFMPVMISISVIALLFDFIYNPQMGLLNGFLEMIGLSNFTTTWLGNTNTAIYAVIAMSQWQSIGYIMMLTIVAIQKIPRQLYEAAEIDGAGKIRQFFSITIPQIRETLFVNVLITITGSMLVFNEPYILTKGGGPGVSSITSAVHMYQEGFFRDNMGYASAIALAIFLITATLGIIQMKFFGTGEDE